MRRLLITLVPLIALVACGDDDAGPATAEYLDALETEGYGDEFPSDDGAARYLATLCDLHARFGDAEMEDDLDRFSARFCDPEDRPDRGDEPEVAAVYPDTNGEPVTIDDTATSFTGETPDPILALERALDADGCEGLDRQYEFWVARVDNPEPVGSMADAFVVHALELHDGAGCTFALDF